MKRALDDERKAYKKLLDFHTGKAKELEGFLDDVKSIDCALNPAPAIMASTTSLRSMPIRAASSDGVGPRPSSCASSFIVMASCG